MNSVAEKDNEIVKGLTVLNGLPQLRQILQMITLNLCWRSDTAM